jgi:hypothetical protein
MNKYAIVFDGEAIVREADGFAFDGDFVLFIEEGEVVFAYAARLVNYVEKVVEP